jgi:hypothetical protein
MYMRYQYKNLAWLAFLCTGALVGSLALAEDSQKSLLTDTDQDGLTNEEERALGTDPSNRDTDGDSYSDGIELESGYDPLRPAPGDKLVQSAPPARTASAVGGNAVAGSDENLTKNLVTEVSTLVQNKTKDGKTDEAVTLDDLDSIIAQVSEKGAKPAELPEIDITTIKQKEMKKKKKESDEEFAARDKKAVLEYFTQIAYLSAAHSPFNFTDPASFEQNSLAFSTLSVQALSAANIPFISDIADKNAKILAEVQKIEVPSTILDMHVRILQTLTFGASLSDRIQSTFSVEDPISQMSVVGELQGYLSMAESLTSDIQKRATEYGIEDFELSL